jgi:hypothetical protein
LLSFVCLRRTLDTFKTSIPDVPVAFKLFRPSSIDGGNVNLVRVGRIGFFWPSLTIDGSSMRAHCPRHAVVMMDSKGVGLRCVALPWLNLQPAKSTMHTMSNSYVLSRTQTQVVVDCSHFQSSVFNFWVWGEVFLHVMCSLQIDDDRSSSRRLERILSLFGFDDRRDDGIALLSSHLHFLYRSYSDSGEANPLLHTGDDREPFL